MTYKPEWLKIRHQKGSGFDEIEKMLKELNLNTVCDEAACPNRSECFNRRTATFMIMGKYCTRNCTFCNVEKNKPLPLDLDEPLNVANAVARLSLKHVVITSVTRDDLPYGGADHFKAVIEAIKSKNINVAVEVLIPDFKGNFEALSKVVFAGPEIIGHNVETVPSLYHEVRPMAVYNRSLEVLKNVKKLSNKTFTKSGIMLGLGETKNEVIQVFEDLKNAECDFITIGQYLSPSKKHHQVVEYVHPNIFDEYRKIAESMNFKHVESGPFVRSSYNADRVFC